MLQYGIVLVVYYNTLLNVNHSIVFNIIIKELITLLQCISHYLQCNKIIIVYVFSEYSCIVSLLL